MKIELDETDLEILKEKKGEKNLEPGYVAFNLLGNQTEYLTLGVKVTDIDLANISIPRMLYNNDTKKMMDETLGFHLEQVELERFKSKEDFRRELIRLISNL